MPTRVIREGWIESEAIASLDAAAERFFLRLLLRADDFGRFHANPALLRSALFPLAEGIRSTDMTRWLAACETAGLVRCYLADGKPFVVVPKFGQRTRAQVSKFPPPPEHGGQMTGTCLASVSPPRTETEAEAETNTETETIYGDGGGGAGGDAPRPPAGTQEVLPVAPSSPAPEPGNKPKQPRPAKLPDAEWLASLAADPAYVGIDVSREHAKCAVWCRNKGCQLTRQRLINWLNRVDRPLGSGPVGTTPRGQRPSYIPADQKEWI